MDKVIEFYQRLQSNSPTNVPAEPVTVPSPTHTPGTVLPDSVASSGNTDEKPNPSTVGDSKRGTKRTQGPHQPGLLGLHTEFNARAKLVGADTAAAEFKQRVLAPTTLRDWVAALSEPLPAEEQQRSRGVLVFDQV